MNNQKKKMDLERVKRNVTYVGKNGMKSEIDKVEYWLQSMALRFQHDISLLSAVGMQESALGLSELHAGLLRWSRSDVPYPGEVEEVTHMLRDDFDTMPTPSYKNTKSETCHCRNDLENTLTPKERLALMAFHNKEYERCRALLNTENKISPSCLMSFIHYHAWYAHIQERKKILFQGKLKRKISCYLTREALSRSQTPPLLISENRTAGSSSLFAERETSQEGQGRGSSPEILQVENYTDEMHTLLNNLQEYNKKGAHKIEPQICKQRAHGGETKPGCRTQGMNQRLAQGLLRFLQAKVMMELNIEQSETSGFLYDAVTLLPSLLIAWKSLLSIQGSLPGSFEEQSFEPQYTWVFWLVRAEFGLQCLRRDQHDSAMVLKDYERLERLFPHSCYILQKMALVRVHMQHYTEAVALYEHISTLDPGRISHFEDFSHVLFMLRDHEKLQKLVSTCAYISTNSTVSHVVSGNMFALQGDHTLSMSHFLEALDTDIPQLEHLILLGQELIHIGHINGAIFVYLKALDQDLSDYRPHFGLAQGYELLHLSTYAKYYYEKCIRLRPKDTKIWFALSNFYEHTGKIAEAIEGYSQALLVEPNMENTQKIDVLKKMAELCSDSKNEDFFARRALLCYERLLRLLEEDVRLEKEWKGGKTEIKNKMEELQTFLASRFGRSEQVS